MSAVTLIGCSSNGGGASKSQPSTVVQVKDMQKDVSLSLPFLNKAYDEITAIQQGKTACTVANLAPVHENIAQAKTLLTGVNEAMPAAVKSAQTDADTIAKTTVKPDTTKTVLDWVGYVTFFGGLAALIASFFVSALFAYPIVRTAGAASIIFGLLVLTVAHFLTTIYWIFGGIILAALVAGGIWLWLHRTVVAAKIEADLPSLATSGTITTTAVTTGTNTLSSATRTPAAQSALPIL